MIPSASLPPESSVNHDPPIDRARNKSLLLLSDLWVSSRGLPVLRPSWSCRAASWVWSGAAICTLMRDYDRISSFFV